MADGNRPYINDNIRTPHLKCDRCKTQVFLERIDRLAERTELRIFRCGNCNATSTIRIDTASEDGKVLPQQQTVSCDQNGHQCQKR